MKIIIYFLALAIAVTSAALEETDVTGTSPPPVPCPNYMCRGKSDGNYAYYYYGYYRANYFVQCVNGMAHCQACFPMSLEFSENCNQCLYLKQDSCVTTKPWTPAVTYHCPDLCPEYGPHQSKNLADPYNTHQYIACWKGVTVGCIACPAGLEFNEEHNSCLYLGLYHTEPDYNF